MPRIVKKPSRQSDRHALSGQLRDVIASRGLTGYALGRLADVDPGVVQRFITGERDIRMETADRLSAVLGLRLVEVGRVRGRAVPARPDPAGRLAPATAPTVEDSPSVDECKPIEPVEGMLESMEVIADPNLGDD